MDRQVIRTKNFAVDAAQFILDQAHNALGERNEFRLALSGGNTPAPVYTRLAAIGHDLPWDLTRMTFTLPLINHARHICFLVGAAKNADLIGRVLEGDPQFPASRVNPSAGEVTWIIG